MPQRADMGAIRQGSSCFPITAIVCSRAEKRNCWDNAPTESFFGKPKVECAYGVDYADHDEENMKRSSTIFLQVVIVLIGIGALALLLWEPHLEGRNTHATLFEIYFKDPFLAYAYLASIPFFVALYQAFKVLGYAGQNKVFSQAAVKALRTIKYCAIAIIGFVAVSVIFMMFERPR